MKSRQTDEMPSMCVNRGGEEAWIVQNNRSCKNNQKVFQSDIESCVRDYISHSHLFVKINVIMGVLPAFKKKKVEV